jgi:hypothetical protein
MPPESPFFAIYLSAGMRLIANLAIISTTSGFYPNLKGISNLPYETEDSAARNHPLNPLVVSRAGASLGVTTQFQSGQFQTQDFWEGPSKSGLAAPYSRNSM